MANWFTDLYYKATTGKSASQIEAEWQAADAALQKDNERLYAEGKLSSADMQVVQAHQMSQEVVPGQIGSATADAFAQGAAEGLAAEQAAVKDAVGGVVGGVLGFVPWWLWAVAAAGGLGWLAYYTGAYKQLNGIAK